MKSSHVRVAGSFGVALLGLALAISPRPAHAVDASKAALAEALFLAGREAVTSGDLQSARAKFSESQRLDPGAGTLINLADCEEKLGLFAASWQHWREATLALPGEDPRRPLAEQRMESVARRVARLTLSSTKALPSGTVIEKDGLELGIDALMVPLPVEVGTYSVLVKAPGREPWSASVALAEGEKKTLLLEIGPPIVVPVLPAPQPIAPTVPYWMKPPEEDPFVVAARRARQRAWALSLGGVAAGSVVTGSVFGLLAASAHSDMNSHCYPAGLYCDAEGVKLAGRGRTFATVSTVSFVVAPVTAIAAGWLYWTLPAVAPAKASAWVGADVAGAQVEGSF